MRSVPVADAAMTLPASMYRDPAIYRRERAVVFGREWIVFARAEQLATPGACVAGVVAGYPLVVVVDREGELRGFHNVCRHRAGPLVDDGEGRASGFVCRYHGWSYDTTGRLVNAREFEVPDTEATLDPEAFSLFPVRAERWRNLVFVNLDTDTGAPALLADLADFFAEAEPFPIEAFHFGGDLAHELGCNWKTYVDNYLEGYHIPFVHPELNREIDARRYSVFVGDRYCRHSAPTRDGAVNAGRWLFRWPNLALNLYPNAMVVERILPTGPHSTQVAYSYFFADPDDPANDEVIRISKAVIEEDRAIVEAVQRNLDAGVYERGGLSPRHEAGVAQFQQLVRTALERPLRERSVQENP
jgi:choline monooxygenase